MLNPDDEYVLIRCCISIAGILSDLIFFILTLWKFLQVSQASGRDNLHIGSISDLQKGMPTIFLFVRDGSFYFFIVLGM
jgi:hypothetical protein